MNINEHVFKEILKLAVQRDKVLLDFLTSGVFANELIQCFKYETGEWYIQ